ncbi:unnamed protein product [Brugia timori]|uniref:Uncharacterized protein n=2 Tax=Brugia TaxID=6278 RepID=A8QHF9_BRUMA|nr:unnamed protein product [Brugia timori]
MESESQTMLACNLLVLAQLLLQIIGAASRGVSSIGSLIHHSTIPYMFTENKRNDEAIGSDSVGMKYRFLE